MSEYQKANMLIRKAKELEASLKELTNIEYILKELDEIKHRRKTNCFSDLRTGVSLQVIYHKSSGGAGYTYWQTDKTVVEIKESEDSIERLLKKQKEEIVRAIKNKESEAEEE